LPPNASDSELPALMEIQSGEDRRSQSQDGRRERERTRGRVRIEGGSDGSEKFRIFRSTSEISSAADSAFASKRNSSIRVKNTAGTNLHPKAMRTVRGAFWSLWEMEFQGRKELPSESGENWSDEVTASEECQQALP
jgi:hypothetical protein